MADEERRVRPTDRVEVKLTISEAARRQLKIVAAECGCSMSNLIEERINDLWKSSPEFLRRMRERGERWHDSTGALRNPDGSIAQAHTHAEERAEREGGAR